MDYEKAYKEALKIMEQVRKDLTKDSWVQSKILKAFPELVESEDERIRKRLVEYFNGYYDRFSSGNNVNVYWESLEVKAVIAWLEKQKEQKPEIKYVYPIFKVGDTIKPKAYNESHLINKIKDGNYVLDNGFTFPIVGQDVWEIIEQKPAEWNEEDETMLENIIQDYDYLCRIWLQDYEKRLGGADLGARIDIRNQITWLKSLHPRPSWKPSEEQIEALWKLIHSAVHLSNWNELEKPIEAIYKGLKQL